MLGSSAGISAAYMHMPQISMFAKWCRDRMDSIRRKVVDIDETSEDIVNGESSLMVATSSPQKIAAVVAVCLVFYRLRRILIK